MGATEKETKELLSRIAADLLARSREGEESSFNIDRLREEIKKEIESTNEIFGKFRGLVESFREIIPEEKQRYHAALKALSCTSGLGQKEILKAADNQLSELKKIEQGFDTLPAWHDELKVLESKSGEIRNQISTLREKIIQLESEEQVILNGKTAREKERKQTEKNVVHVLDDIATEIADIKGKIEEATAERVSSPRTTPPDSIQSHESAMEESDAGREGDFRKVSEPQEVEAEKKCPLCGSPKWYPANKGWKCFVCEYEEIQNVEPENMEWPFPAVQTGFNQEVNHKIMKELSSEELFEIGTKWLKEEKYRDALAVLNEAVKRSGCENDADIPPHYLSYLGLAMALAENRFRNGALFCEKAIRKEFYNPSFYLNLGKVYFAGGYKLKAIDAFYDGLKIDGENIEIRAELQKIGVRHKPVISFLPRTHVINKYLGLLFYNGKSQYFN